MSTPPRRADTELPQGREKVRAVRSMFDTIAPRYDLVNRVMTFGLDVRWRRQTILALGLPTGSTVVDLACGTGDLCRELQGAGQLPIGVDLSLGMLRANDSGAPLAQSDATELALADGSVDGAACGFALRNFVTLPPVMTELSRVVRPGGRIALLEVGEPRGRIMAAGHGVYFGRVVPLIGGALSDRAAYRYLPRSVSYLPPVDELLAIIRAAGFGAVFRRELSGGIAQLITATRR